MQSSLEQYDLWGPDSGSDDLEPATLGSEGGDMSRLRDRQSTSFVDYKCLYELQLEKTRELQRTITELKREIKLLRHKNKDILSGDASSSTNGGVNPRGRVKLKEPIELSNSVMTGDSSDKKASDNVQVEWDRIVLQEKNRKKNRPIVVGGRRRHRITALTASTNISSSTVMAKPVSLVVPSLTPTATNPDPDPYPARSKVSGSDLWISSEDESPDPGSSAPIRSPKSDSGSSGWDSDNRGDDSDSTNFSDDSNSDGNASKSIDKSIKTGETAGLGQAKMPVPSEQAIEQAVLNWSVRKGGHIVALLQSVGEVFHGTIDESAANSCRCLTACSSLGEIRRVYLTLIKQIHPDKQGSGAADCVKIEAVKVFAALSDAYNHYKAISA